MLQELKQELFERADARMKKRIIPASTLEEARRAVQEGIAVIQWCGSFECAEVVEKEVDASILGTDLRSEHITEVPETCLVCGASGSPAIIARTY
jgi:prolyl-tRNA synthetase